MYILRLSRKKNWGGGNGPWVVVSWIFSDIPTLNPRCPVSENINFVKSTKLLKNETWVGKLHIMNFHSCSVKFVILPIMPNRPILAKYYTVFFWNQKPIYAKLIWNSPWTAPFKFISCRPYILPSRWQA